MLLTVVSDAAFCFVCAFSFSFFIFGYFTDLTFAAVFALLTGAVFSAVSFKFLSDKRKKKLIDKTQKKDCENAAFALSVLTDDKIKALFFNAFTIKRENPKRVKHGLYLQTSATFFLPAFSPYGATKTDVIKAFNGIIEGGNAVIYCVYAENAVKDFAKRFSGKIEIKEKEYAYTLLKETNLLPAAPVTIKETKKIREFLSEFLKKEKARGFFLAGLFFLVTGTFVRFKIYYYVFGALLTCLAIACRTFGKRLKN